MKAAKERKMDRKRKHKALAVSKTTKSRQRRLDNKAKRAEIISINSHAKIDIVNQETYVDGVKVEVVNNKIIPVKPDIVEEIPTVEVFNAETEDVERVDVTNVSRLQNIFKKW